MKIFSWNISRAPSQAALKKVGTQTRVVQGGGWSRVFDWIGGGWQADAPYANNDGTVRAEHSPTVYACMRAIAEDIAKLGLKVLKLQANSLVWKPAIQSPFLSLIRKPNAYQTRVQFVTHWLLSLLFHGNTYVYKRRDGSGKIVEMHILPAFNGGVQVLLDEQTGEIFYDLPAWPLAGIPVRTTVSSVDIIHDRYMTLHHPLIGSSPLQIAQLDAAVDLHAVSMVGSVFANNGIMPGLLEVAGDYDEAQLTALQVRWDSLRKQGKTAVVSTGAKFTSMASKAADSQVTEQRGVSRSEICAAFGVPEWRISQQTITGSPSTVIFTSLEYYTQTLQPRIESIEALLDDGLGLAADTAIEFDINSLYRLDPSARITAASNAVKGGIWSINEAREGENLEAVDGGEFPMMQQQYWPLPQLAKRKEVPGETPEPTASAPAQAAPISADDAGSETDEPVKKSDEEQQ